MANQRKGGSAAQNKRTKLIVTVAVIAVALLITFAPYMNLPFDIPTWGELLSGDKQTVQDGDALILLSDGVMDAVDGNEKWLTEEILAMDLRDAEGAARRLISHARAVGKHEDDMTVCVLRLVRRHG